MVNSGYLDLLLGIATFELFKFLFRRKSGRLSGKYLANEREIERDRERKKERKH